MSRMPGAGPIDPSLREPCLESVFLDPKRTSVLIAGGPPILPARVFLISDVEDMIDDVMDSCGSPDLMVLMLGTNDLKSFYFDKAPEVIGKQLMDLAKAFGDRGISRILIMEVLPRFGKHAEMAGLDTRFGHDEIDVDSWEA
ncbi:MAG: hypothetical protein GY774_25625, partial [Planctomycetes bacterium]|nr:hypothetical protein [Planctomycetota bacterium]